MTNTELAKAFSLGEFESIYPFIFETAEWIVIGESHFSGKAAIIENCKQVGNYFKTVTTNFKTVSIISEGNKVVLTGTAEFLKDNERIVFVHACDIYEFNDENKIQSITSYCISEK